MLGRLASIAQSLVDDQRLPAGNPMSRFKVLDGKERRYGSTARYFDNWRTSVQYDACVLRDEKAGEQRKVLLTPSLSD
jgi:hypothetical protein